MDSAWRRHDIEKLPVLLTLCEGNLPVTGGFPLQRASDDFLDVNLNDPLNKHSGYRWSETPYTNYLIWRQCVTRWASNQTNTYINLKLLHSAVLWFGFGMVDFIHSPALLRCRWGRGNRTIAPVPVKQPRRKWLKRWHQSTKNYNMSITKQKTRRPHIVWDTRVRGIIITVTS